MTSYPCSAPPLAREPWPGRADVVAQVLLQAAIALVLAAMAVNWLDVFLHLFHTDPEKVEQAVDTWLADVVALAVLTTAGVLHSLVRRGRAGRWPTAVACVVLPAAVLGCPLLAG